MQLDLPRYGPMSPLLTIIINFVIHIRLCILGKSAL